MALTLEEFVKQVEDSGILAGDTIKDLIAPRGPARNTEELARELVRHEKLTAFQAKQVIQGSANALVVGAYIILDKIGEGGMGQVFRALHRRMDRTVAIKMLPQAICRNTAAVARFEREAKAAAKLMHPNIVTAFDADRANGVHFLVMQYVEGQDLAAMVKKTGPIPFAQAVDYILQAACGLEYAHKMGVVHRDIKPSNLLVDNEGHVKILDMGLARIEPSGTPTSGDFALTDSGVVIGSIDYMSPEQALNTKNADERSDIYSLGCSLYYLMVGKAVFAGDSVIERVVAHREKPIPSLRELQSNVPIELEVIFRKMLAKKAAARYQSMTEVAGALKRCIASFDAPPPPPPDTNVLDDDALAFLLDDEALEFLKKNPADFTVRQKRLKTKSRPNVKAIDDDPKPGKKPVKTRNDSNSRVSMNAEQPEEAKSEPPVPWATPLLIVIAVVVTVILLSIAVAWWRSSLKSTKSGGPATVSVGVQPLAGSRAA